EKPLSAIYFDGDAKVYMIKRFLAEKSGKPVSFIPEGEKINLELISSDWKPMIQVNFRKQKGEDEAKSEEINVEEFIAVKGLKAKGNTLTKESVNTIDALDPIPFEPPTPEPRESENEDKEEEAEEAASPVESTTVELEVEDTSKSEKTESEEPQKKEPKLPPTDDSEGQLGLF
ncbi:MAG: hypothetical protein ACPG5W_12645, partial [Flavobacteriales bacterium]